MIPGNLHNVDIETLQKLIDTNLDEINDEYRTSVKKSILDYILKSEDEMKRVGIQ